MAEILELKAISKQYGAVSALRNVDLTVTKGEVVAICGDNGAGKSTLIRIISGAEIPSDGEMFLFGRKIRMRSPAEALANGVATTYQDLALAPGMKIYQNVFMGAELTKPFIFPFVRILDKSAMKQAAASYLDRLNVNIPDMEAPVETLSGGQRQAVAISRALRWKAGLVIMDEPTAALGVKETAQVLDLIRQLRDQGVTVLLISHNMEDVISVANRVVILKSGEKAGECLTDRLGSEDLAAMVMTGRIGT